MASAIYKACIISLEAALDLDVDKLDVYKDSMLIIFQVREWQTNDEEAEVIVRLSLEVG